MRLGEYELVRPLGEGGFATVWLARHHAWDGRLAAAKLIQDPERVRHLRNEGQCLARLSHPHIAGALGMDLDHDPPYLLVEFHDGRTLREILDEEAPLAPDRAKAIFRQLVRALASSHDEGVVHGDLKPENVLVTVDDRVKVSDFGLGRIRARQASICLSGELRTETRGLAGTIPYMAPEQQEGQDPDPRTDVFTLGILLFEMLAGRRPQPGDDLADVLRGEPAWADVFSRTYTRRDRRYEDATVLAAALGLDGDGPPPGPREDEPGLLWTVEQIEEAICREVDVSLRDMRQGTFWKGARARNVAILLLHRHADCSTVELAERYRMPVHKVQHQLRNGRWIPTTNLLRGVSERLAPLPADVSRSLGSLEGSLANGAMAIWATLGLGPLLMGAGIVTILTGLEVAGILLVYLGLIGVSAAIPLRSRLEHRKRELEAILESVPGRTEEERLERLAMRYDLPRVRDAAVDLLERRYGPRSETREEPTAEEEGLPRRMASVWPLTRRSDRVHRVGPRTADETGEPARRGLTTRETLETERIERPERGEEEGGDEEEDGEQAEDAKAPVPEETVEEEPETAGESTEAEEGEVGVENGRETGSTPRRPPLHEALERLDETDAPPEPETPARDVELEG